MKIVTRMCYKRQQIVMQQFKYYKRCFIFLHDFVRRWFLALMCCSNCSNCSWMICWFCSKWFTLKFTTSCDGGDVLEELDPTVLVGVTPNPNPLTRPHFSGPNIFVKKSFGPDSGGMDASNPFNLDYYTSVE